MNNEFEKIWGERGGEGQRKERERKWLHLRNQPDICLEGQIKPGKAPPSRDL
jgi:hypothetical protein